MAQLISMKQRIKTVEAIQKITHAMQLISMSAHLRLRDKKNKTEEYQQLLAKLFFRIKQQVPGWDSEIFYPKAHAIHKTLIILIGSQKGLCGAFNTNLFKMFEKELKKEQFSTLQLITIGKKATEYVETHTRTLNIPLEHIASYDLAIHVLPTTITHLFNTITTQKTPYSRVMVYSNYSISFFAQRQQATTLIPLPTTSVLEMDSQDDYIWEENAQEVVTATAQQYLRSLLYSLIIQSLLAEQAARFISMDSATRNAQQLREAMKLQYNKLRQAKITKELTELSGSF
jgi:F-type H+-transporting ATPase subunit gamma